MLYKQKGSITILALIIFFILCGFAGLTLDLWNIYYTKQKIQHAVDFAALAASQEVMVSTGKVISTAHQYAQKNGMEDGETEVIYPYEGDSYKVGVRGMKKIDLAFLPLFGFKDIDVEARAVAGVEWYDVEHIVVEEFQFAIFHGSSLPSEPLTIKGNSSRINGNVRSNSSISTQGASHYFGGNVEASRGVSLGNSTVTGVIDDAAPVLPIPVIDFEDYAARAEFFHSGNLTLNNKTDIDGIWLIDGDLTIQGAKLAGRGILLVNGHVKITGSLQYNNPKDLMAVYTKKNIDISASGATIYGALYAPQGAIFIRGTNNEFNGALIAHEIVWTGSDMRFDGNFDYRVPQAFTEQKQTFVLLK